MKPSLQPLPDPSTPPPRRSDFPFPPYRYVPGLNAHPLRHPQGHRSPHPAGRAAALAYAADLFDHRYLWEAHEVWEALWKDTPEGPERQRLQGLIQAAAYLLKRHMGHPAPRLLEAARRRLAGHHDRLREQLMEDGWPSPLSTTGA